jgi:hypothetical protein
MGPIDPKVRTVAFHAKLVRAQRRIRLPDQHRFVEPAAEQIRAEIAYLLEVKTEQLVARGVHPNSPSRSLIKPSTETLIEKISIGL